MDIEKQSMTELLDEMRVSNRFAKRKRSCKIACSLLRLIVTIVVILFVLFILYSLYQHFSGLSSVFSSFSSVLSCVSAPIVCLTPVEEKTNVTYFALEKDKDVTLVQFLEEYEKCKVINMGDGSSLFSDRFVLEACLCDIKQEAFRAIQNCSFSGNFSTIAQHCYGMDVPDCKKHIQDRPIYKDLPKAAPIKNMEAWRCDISIWARMAHKIGKVLTLGLAFNQTPEQWRANCLKKLT